MWYKYLAVLWKVYTEEDFNRNVCRHNSCVFINNNDNNIIIIIRIFIQD